ncbi:MAG: FHA domain-containing protein [Chloroflexota bacterium]
MLFGLCLGLLAWSVVPAQAQEGVIVRLSPPIADEFPQVTLYASVLDASGRRLPSLPSGAFQVVEDEQTLGEVLAREVPVGTRQVFVVNTSRGLRFRDAFGLTRYDYVRRALAAWWRQSAATSFGADDLTLVTADGTLLAHRPSAAELASHLDAHQPTFAGPITDYDLLLQALDFVSDPSPRPGMPNFLLFFTPWIEAGREASLVNVIARAKETGTVVYAILAAPAEALTLPEADNLRRLASETGGELLLFDPSAGITALGDKILDQRTQYQLSFTSSANTSGSHSLLLRVVSGEVTIPSNEVAYRVEVLPPEVAVVDPPELIVRQSDDPRLLPVQWPPTQQTLRVVVTFPDHHPRPIVASRLVVDGTTVVERVLPPYASLSWDLTAYHESGAHVLSIEVEDSLGLVGTTPPLSVRVEIVEPRRGLAALQPALAPLLVVAAILVLGVVVFARLIAPTRRNRPRQAAAPRTTARRPPLIRASLQRPEQLQPPEAYLDPVGRSLPLKPVPLTGVDVTLGRDASLSSVVLEDPSVAGMHARVIRQAGGDYLIRDQGTVAGTWVNFEPVPPQGLRLNHADLIHVGRVAFRFRLVSPPQPKPVHVRPAPERRGRESGDGA